MKRDSEAVKTACGIGGAVSPVIGLLSVLDAAHRYPGFSWTNSTQAISDIFTSKADPIITTGIVGAAILMSGAAVQLYKSFSGSKMLRIGSVLLGAGGMSLGLVGLSQGELSFMHVPATYGYFATTTFSLLTMGAAFLKQNCNKVIGIATTVAAGAAVLMLMNMAYAHSHMAVKEFVSSTTLGFGISFVSTSLIPDKLLRR